MSELDDAGLDALLRKRAPRSTPAEPELDPGELQAWRSGRLDAEQAAAVEDVLARSAADRAVLGQLAEPTDAALLDRMVAAAPRSRGMPGRRSKVAWIGAGLALAAGVAITVLRPSAPDAPGYTLGAVRGAVKATRAEETPLAPGEVAVFVPDGTLRLTVRPTAEHTAGAAQAFAACGDAPLAPVDGVSAGDAGAWTLVAPARALFGDPPARCVVGIALAADRAAFDGIAGGAPSAAARPGVSWVPLTVDYRATEEAP